MHDFHVRLYSNITCSLHVGPGPHSLGVGLISRGCFLKERWSKKNQRDSDTTLRAVLGEGAESFADPLRGIYMIKRDC